MKDLEGFDERYPLNSRLVKQDGKIVEEVYRVGGRYGSQIAAVVKHLSRRDSVRDRADGGGAPRADRFLHRPARRRTARRTTSRGCATRRRRSTRSTASPRCISTRAASKARGKRSSSTSTPRRPPRSRSSPPTRSGSRIGCRGIPKYRKAGRPGHHRERHRRRHRDGRLRSGDADRHQPAQRSIGTRAVRQQVGVALERQRGLRQVDAAGVPHRVLLDAGGSGAGGEVGRARRRADDEHARGHRPRVGQGRGAAQGQSAGGAEGAVLGARGSAGRSGRAVFPARSEARRARPRRQGGSRRDRAGRVRGLHAQRDRAAAARARRERSSKKTTCATAR